MVSPFTTVIHHNDKIKNVTMGKSEVFRTRKYDLNNIFILDEENVKLQTAFVERFRSAEAEKRRALVKLLRQ